jgi:hypothetical protein
MTSRAMFALMEAVDRAVCALCGSRTSHPPFGGEDPHLQCARGAPQGKKHADAQIRREQIAWVTGAVPRAQPNARRGGGTGARNSISPALPIAAHNDRERERPNIVGAMFSASHAGKAARLASSRANFSRPYELQDVPTVHRPMSVRAATICVTGNSARTSSRPPLEIHPF